MAQRHARLTIIINRELRKEGIAQFKLYAPGEYHSDKFVLLICKPHYELALCVLAELYLGDVVLVCIHTFENKIENSLQLTQQTENK